jgi:hypothetical protein
MTICIAALAADSKAIVCVADKALSYGEEIQWDSDSAKMIYLEPANSIVMFSGDESGISSVLSTFLETEGECGFGKTKTRKWCEQKYKEALDETLGIKFLQPRLLDREKYVAAITAAQINPYISSVAKEIDAFNLKCDLLVCGFDVTNEPEKRGKPFIFDLSHPGQAADMTHTGFQAIGSGWSAAVSRMLWSEHKRSNPLERVLYDAFDAKAIAELTPSVGFEWDAAITIGRNRHQVPDEIKEIVEQAWVHSTRSPFDKYDKKKDKDPPPHDWKKQLKDYCRSVMR